MSITKLRAVVRFVRPIWKRFRDYRLVREKIVQKAFNLQLFWGDAPSVMSELQRMFD